MPPPPHTATDIHKVEAVQRKAARWVYRDYSYTSSVTAMLKHLKWRSLDQGRIDSRLIILYKVTYDLVAIPASQYLTRKTRLSRHTHPLSYRQIPTLKDYYRFTFFPRSFSNWNALPAYIPVPPTLAQFSSAICQVAHAFENRPPAIARSSLCDTSLRKAINHYTSLIGQ